MDTPSKKIVFTVTNDLSHDQRMQRICNSLVNAGFRVLLIGRYRVNSEILQEEVFEQKRIRCLFNTGFLFYAEFNFRLFIHLLFTSFDIVGAIDLDTILATLWSAKLKKKAHTYDAHEYFPESPELIGRPHIQSIWNAIEIYGMKRTDAAYTVSTGIQALLIEKHSKQVGLVRNLPMHYKVSKQVLSNRYIIYQGALNIGRGLEAMISAMPFVDAELWLAGDGDIKEELKNLVSEKKLHKVKFLGKLSPSDLREITQNAIVGVNLLEPIGQSYLLSLSNKFFDYIMAEIPQICIDFSEYRALNNEFEVAKLVKTTAVEEIVEATNSLIKNEEERVRFIEQCKIAKETLNWENESQQLIKIYQELG